MARKTESDGRMRSTFFLSWALLFVCFPSFFFLFTSVCHLELSIYHDTTFLVVALLFAVSPFFSLFIAFSFGHHLFYRHCIPSFPSLSLLRHDSSSLPFAFFILLSFDAHTHRERDSILTHSLNSDYKATSLSPIIPRESVWPFGTLSCQNPWPSGVAWRICTPLRIVFIGQKLGRGSLLLGLVMRQRSFTRWRCESVWGRVSVGQVAAHLNMEHANPWSISAFRALRYPSKHFQDFLLRMIAMSGISNWRFSLSKIGKALNILQHKKHKFRRISRMFWAQMHQERQQTSDFTRLASLDGDFQGKNISNSSGILQESLNNIHRQLDLSEPGSWNCRKLTGISSMGTVMKWQRYWIKIRIGFFVFCFLNQYRSFKHILAT